MFYRPLQETVAKLLARVDSLDDERRERLKPLTRFVQQRVDAEKPVRLNFICTHNSRRSHLGQIWGAVAAAHFKIPRVTTFSGGTEATAFNPRAVRAIERDGFLVKNPGGENPRYEVSLGEGLPPLVCFSKTFDDPFNAAEDFAAIMTCTDADQNCPVILGATRISLPYRDPKEADDTPDEAARYTERSHQIGTEMLAAFAAVTAKSA
jgi:arsenate reductase